MEIFISKINTNAQFVGSIIPGVEFYKNNNCGNYKKNKYIEYLNQKREREKQKKEEISERELKENENFKKK